MRYGALLLGAAVLAGPVQACRMRVAPDLTDVRYAALVVIGRIENYRIVRDEAFRAGMLAAPGLSAEARAPYEDPKQSLLPDYARFDILVERVLLGEAPARLSVTWDNSTFGEPAAIAPGRYLIALRRPNAAGPPLRGSSASILPNPEPDALTLLQAPCSSAFLYPAESERALAIERLLLSPPLPTVGF